MTLMLVGDFMLENLLLMIEQYNPDQDEWKTIGYVKEPHEGII